MADKPAPPVKLPDMTQIDSIEITPTFGEVRTTRRIVERQTIGQFVQFINERDSGWATRADTPRAGNYVVAAKQEGKLVAQFRLGGQQIDGFEKTNGSRFRRISAKDWEELKSVLNIAER